MLTYGILKRFVTFICCHPVYLFYENPTPKVNLPLSTSLTSDWRKNPECNLRTELLNKEAFKPSKCHVPHTHVPDRLLFLTAGGTPVRMGVTSLIYSNATTFMFCCVECLPAWFSSRGGENGAATRQKGVWSVAWEACGTLLLHTTASVGPGQQAGALLKSSPGHRPKWSLRAPTRGRDRSAPENSSSRHRRALVWTWACLTPSSLGRVATHCQ